MSRKMTLKFCPECNKPFRSRRSVAKHIAGYVRKYDGKVFERCTGPRQDASQYFEPLKEAMPTAGNVGLSFFDAVAAEGARKQKEQWELYRKQTKQLAVNVA